MENSETDPSQTDVYQLRQRIVDLEAERRQQQSTWATCAQLAEIGQVVAGVAHELKNPLTVILGFAQRLQRQNVTAPEISDSVVSIEREALRCNRLVQDILNFSRRSPPYKVREDVLEVLNNALALINPLARARKIEARRIFTPNLPSVYLDRHRIQQVLINVCTNALDAMPEGGYLTLEALPPGPGDMTLKICVSDTGRGIPLDVRARIFEPFFTTKDPGKGTGLGLSMAQEIMKEHNGQIQIDSKIGKGTKVTLILPLGEPTSPEQSPTLAPTDNAQA